MSDIYYDLHMEGDGPEERSTLSKVLSIIGKTVTATVVALIFFILFYRMWEMKEPGGTGDYLWTAATDSAYEELKGTSTTVSSKYPEDQFSYEYESHNTVTVTKKGQDEEGNESYQRITLPSKEYYSKIGFEIFTQRLVSYRVEDEEGKEEIVNRSEYFEVKDHPVERALRVTHVYLVPAAKQVQLTFRYNNSTLKHVKEDYALAEVPGRGVEIFDVSVVRITDITPDDTSDNVDGNENLKKERFAPSSRVINTTGLYTYVLYTFDGVAMTADTITAYLDVYYSADVDYSKDAYGTLRLYHTEDPKLPVELSGKERKALNG
jgi:hypothetical protein